MLKRILKIIITILMIVVISIVIFLGLDFWTEGHMSALVGKYTTERFLTALEKGKFEKASNYIKFYDDPDIPLSVDEEKEQWVLKMQQLEEEGVKFVSHSDVTTYTDDHFTSGTAKIEVSYNEKSYNLDLGIYCVSGRDLLGIRVKSGSNEDEPIIKKISDAIHTHSFAG